MYKFLAVLLGLTLWYNNNTNILYKVNVNDRDRAFSWRFCYNIFEREENFLLWILKAFIQSHFLIQIYLVFNFIENKFYVFLTILNKHNNRIVSNTATVIFFA